MKRLILLALLSFIVGCAATTATIPANTPQEWLRSDRTFRLRHDGILQLSQKTVPMTGFMILDTKKRKARLALLTGLGIKLATLEISEAAYTVIKSNPVADTIPHFLDECASTIQRVFLDAPTSSTWSVRYEGSLITDDFSLPKKTIFTNHEAGYTVSLQLNKADVQ